MITANAARCISCVKQLGQQHSQQLLYAMSKIEGLIRCAAGNGNRSVSGDITTLTIDGAFPHRMLLQAVESELGKNGFTYYQGLMNMGSFWFEVSW